MGNTWEQCIVVVLFFFGPFFGYPWKPLFNMAVGNSYKIGYKHFWAQHQDVFNLLWHLNCMVFQLAGNFWLLNRADEYIFGEGHQVLSLITAASWIIYLFIPKECPLHVKICSAVTISLAYWMVPTYSMEDVLRIVFPVFVVVWALLVLKRGFHLKDDAPLIILLLLIKVVLALTLPSSSLAGALADKAQVVGVFYILLLLLLSLQMNAIKVIVVVGSTLGQVLTVLTGEELYFLHSCAFTATLLQGLAHSLSGETATLIKLMDESNHGAKVSYEWSHVTFFPNLLFHALSDVMLKARKKM